MPYPKLFSPAAIGNVSLKNRVVMGPTETLYATAIGEVTQPMIDYYTERARGGVGLIVLHSVQTCTDIDPIDPYAGSLRLDNDAYIPALRSLTESVHAQGAKIAVLASIGGGAMAKGERYLGKSDSLNPSLVAPSADVPGTRGRPVRALTQEEIRSIVASYGQCARRAREAGFDLFFIHALGGYLLAEFLSPIFNHRTDSYGGPLENRARLLLELISSCQICAGKDFPLVVRFSVDECHPCGRTLEESEQLCTMLERAGVAALDVSLGYAETRKWRTASIYVDCSGTDAAIRAIKEKVSIPVFHQGKLNDPDRAEYVLQQNIADFVVLARGLIADPEWVNKVQTGRIKELRKCLCCNYCLANRIVKNLPLRCAFNPQAGRESLCHPSPGKAPFPKKVAIVGAGPAGLEAARILGWRGYKVDLYEEGKCLCAGQISLAGKPPCKGILQNIPQYYAAQLKKLPNVRVHFARRIRKEELMQLEASAIVIATGAQPIVPHIPGVDLPWVVTAQSVLAGRKTGQRVLVAGGGQVGAETAHYLAQQGKEVLIVEQLPEIAGCEEPNTRQVLLQELEELGVQVRCQRRILSFGPEGVEMEWLCTGEKEVWSCDTAVLSFGTKPDDSFIECRVGSKPLYFIGDAAGGKTIKDAIEQGFLFGWNFR